MNVCVSLLCDYQWRTTLLPILDYGTKCVLAQYFTCVFWYNVRWKTRATIQYEGVYKLRKKGELKLGHMSKPLAAGGHQRSTSKLKYCIASEGSPED